MDGKNVEIPEELFQWVEERLPKTEFETVDEYVTYVISEVKEKVLEEEAGEDEDSGFSKEDEEKVKERLRALGYLE